jgi:hypothetical protein
MKIKIISDGTPMGTHVTNADTGEKLELVRSVAWTCEIDKLATATITVSKVPISVVGETGTP